MHETRCNLVLYHRLQEIEATHSQILRTLTNRPANKVPGDLSQAPPTAAGNISLDRVSVDGESYSKTGFLRGTVQLLISPNINFPLEVGLLPYRITI